MPDKTPQPVIIASDIQDPVPVVIEASVPSAPTPMPATVTKLEGVTLPPTTTEEQDKVTSRQSRISVLWESSQSLISLAITGAVIYCQIQGIQSETLNNAFFFVVATYLQRTNHVRIGGVGAKPYEGR